MTGKRAVRAIALTVCVSATLLAGELAYAAPAMKCTKSVESAWAHAGVDKADVIATTARDRAVGGGNMLESSVHARLKSCSGMLVVNLSKTCQVRDVYTTGDCKRPGVSAYP